MNIKSADEMIGKHVIIRTYSAGVWFGILEEKVTKEVVLSEARRMYKWRAKKGITLSEISIYGIVEANSRISEAVNSVWMEAIEIIPCMEESIKSLTDARNTSPQ